jgi:hypothetical protein
MRGDDRRQGAMFSYITLEERVPEGHPLRPIRKMTDRALAEMSPEFDQLYSAVGRPSIAPERLLRALLIQVLYTIRSERKEPPDRGSSLLYGSRPDGESQRVGGGCPCESGDGQSRA